MPVRVERKLRRESGRVENYAIVFTTLTVANS